MFYGLVSGHVGAPDLEFEHVLTDLQTLNQWAMEGRLEVTAVSIHAYAFVWQKYAVMTHGMSAGVRSGPMLVARTPRPVQALQGARIAVPGKLTTAHLGLRLCVRDFEPVVTPFDAIPERVASGEVDAGLLIHEAQLTHGGRGLVKVWDMGEWWHDSTGLPLPLGVNVVRRDLGPAVMRRVSGLLRESIAYGVTHRAAALEYALPFARGTDRQTTDTFIGMYVNDVTLDLGDDGKLAVQLLFERGQAAGLLPSMPAIDWVE